MKIGWIADAPTGFMLGGAELSSDELVAAAPESVDIVRCTPSRVEEDVDAYVVMNCRLYSADIIAALERKPVVKSVRDQWAYDDDGLRDWLLANARLTVFNSPTHLAWFMFPVHTPTICVPPPVNLERFRHAAANATDRNGMLWLGAMYRTKGVFEAAAWAMQHKTQVDFWGSGTYIPKSNNWVHYRGVAEYKDVPEIMARYKSFLYMTRGVESFGRTIVEAWASGLELNLRGLIGAQWWIKNDPDALECGAQMFWDAAMEAIS